MLKSGGPNMDPWGTPNIISSYELYSECNVIV